MPQHDAGVETSRLVHLVEKVRSDPGLDPIEQETLFRWAGVDDHAWVYTEERGMMLPLLRSPVARIHKLRISDEERFGATVHPKRYQQGYVTGIGATVPIGAVKVKSVARSSSKRSLVISDHDPSEESK